MVELTVTLVETGMFLLLICSVLTGLIVQGIKIMLKDKEIKAPNILAAIVSVVVGVAVSICWIIICNVQISGTVVCFVIALIVMSWLCAMLGYDKVVQTIMQVIGKGDSK